MKHLLRTLLVLGPVVLSAQSIVGTKHDLSANASVTAAGGKQICIFCHTPHNAPNNTNGPLWNRNYTPGTFTMYTPTLSGTTVAGQPGPASMACLSCHDGTVAMGSLANTATMGAITYTAGSGLDGDGKINGAKTLIGTNLTNDHPIAITYGGPAKGLVAVPTAAGFANGVRLYPNAQTGLVECASCHAVHSNQNAPFLRVSNSASVLCLTCHAK